MKKQKQAFTIIETLTTLLAITIMITAPLTFMYKSYKYSEFVFSKTISMSLSQEGLELVTSLRNSDLNTFSASAANCVQGCMVDWDGVSNLPTIVPCFTGNYQDECKLSTSPNSFGDELTGQHRYVSLKPNGTGGYLAESVTWAFVENIKVEARLTKMIFEIKVKDLSI